MKQNEPKSLVLIALCAICFVLFSACRHNSPENKLSESELFFYDKLSSISSDGDTFYIGTEDGLVYVYDSKENSMDTLFTDCSRIYKVVRDATTYDREVFWIGVRNQGLFRCVMTEDSLVTERKYEIPVKGLKYSAYDICVNGKDIFVGTSHGLFMVPKDDSASELKPLALVNTKISSPVVVNSLKKLGDRYLFCASDDGLLRVDMEDLSVDTFFNNQKVYNIELRDSNVYALMDKKLVVVDVDGKEEHSYPQEIPSKHYSYIDGSNFFIDNNYLLVVKDEYLDNPKQYKRVNLRRSVRIDCHNIVANDRLNNQMLLVTNNALFKIPHHLDVFNSIGNVRFVSIDGDYIYYLVGDRLFRQKKDARVARHIMDMSKGVSHMDVEDGYLYFVDNDRSLYKVKIRGSYFANSIMGFPDLICRFDKDVTAVEGFDNSFYVGIRDSLVAVDKSGKNIDVSLYSDMTRKVKMVDPYITMFLDCRMTASGDSLMFATLNDGIYCGAGTSFQMLPGSDRHSFIRDIVKSDNDTYVLTDKYIARNDSVLWNSDTVNGMTRILLAKDGSLYGLKEFGIMHLGDGSEDSGHTYLRDIHFNPQAVASCDGKIYAGSSCGVFVFDSLRLEDGKEAGFDVVQLELAPQFMSRVALSVLFCILIAIILFIWGYDRFKTKKREREYEIDKRAGQIQNLLLRHENILVAKEYFDEAICSRYNNIDRWLNELYDSKEKGDEARIRSLENQISDLTSDVRDLLHKHLDTQIESLQTSGFECSSLLESSARMMDTEDISMIVGQIIKNNSELEKIEEHNKQINDLLWRIDSMSTASLYMEDAAKEEVESIRKALLDIRNNIKNGTDTEIVPLTERATKLTSAVLKKLYEMLDIQIKKMESSDIKYGSLLEDSRKMTGDGAISFIVAQINKNEDGLNKMEELKVRIAGYARLMSRIVECPGLTTRFVNYFKLHFANKNHSDSYEVLRNELEEFENLLRFSNVEFERVNSLYIGYIERCFEGLSGNNGIIAKIENRRDNSQKGVEELKIKYFGDYFRELEKRVEGLKVMFRNLQNGELEGHCAFLEEVYILHNYYKMSSILFNIGFAFPCKEIYKDKYPDRMEKDWNFDIKKMSCEFYSYILDKGIDKDFFDKMDPRISIKKNESEVTMSIHARILIVMMSLEYFAVKHLRVIIGDNSEKTVLNREKREVEVGLLEHWEEYKEFIEEHPMSPFYFLGHVYDRLNNKND